MAGTLDKLRAPFETLDVSSVVTRVKALLRDHHPKQDFVSAARRLTRLEDWLETHHPKLDRSVLRKVRREAENRGE